MFTSNDKSYILIPEKIEMLANKISLQLLGMEEHLDKAQASVYAKIGQKRLISLAKEGKIKGYPDPNNKGQWIFLKSSLRRYRVLKIETYQSGITGEPNEEKILNSLRRKAGLNEKR